MTKQKRYSVVLKLMNYNIRTSQHMTEIKLKRVYEDPEGDDGFRVLVDRLWPRGMRKDHLKYDLWAKEVTPSPNLRKWFHEDIKNRWNDFVTMYQKELDGSDEVKDFIKIIESHNIVTLLYASREPLYNHASILKAYLEKVLGKM
ncbi:DUF488 family protein [Dysgonomonas termitidis]